MTVCDRQALDVQITEELEQLKNLIKQIQTKEEILQASITSLENRQPITLNPIEDIKTTKRLDKIVDVIEEEGG